MGLTTLISSKFALEVETIPKNVLGQKLHQFGHMLVREGPNSFTLALQPDLQAMDSSWSHETSVHRHSCKGADKYGHGHLQTLRLKNLLLKLSQNLNKWYFSRMNTWSS